MIHTILFTTVLDDSVKEEVSCNIISVPAKPDTPIIIGRDVIVKSIITTNPLLMHFLTKANDANVLLYSDENAMTRLHLIMATGPEDISIVESWIGNDATTIWDFIYDTVFVNDNLVKETEK